MMMNPKTKENVIVISALLYLLDAETGVDVDSWITNEQFTMMEVLTNELGEENQEDYVKSLVEKLVQEVMTNETQSTN